MPAPRHLRRLGSFAVESSSAIPGDGTCATVRPRGEITLATSPSLLQQLADATTGAALVLVDLTAVTSIEQAGMNVLDHAMRAIESAGVEVHVLAPYPSDAARHAV